MSNLFRNVIGAIAAPILAFLLLPSPSAAQTASRNGEVVNPASDGGNPYFSGIWRNERDGTCNMEDANYDGCGVGERSEARPVRSRIVDPPDGKIPYLPWARAKQQEVLKNFRTPKLEQHVDLQSRCVPGGITRPLMHSIYQLIQTPGYVVFLHENFHLYRVIPLDGRPHVGKDLVLWMGDSRGRWEGTTLVVDTINLNGRMWFDVVGNFHSDALRVVERFTVVDPNTIHWEGRFDDPSVYSRPWTMAFNLKREQQPVELMEWACWEGEPRLRQAR